MRLSRSPPIEKPLSDRMLCFKVDPLIVEGTDFPPLRRMETPRFFLFYFALPFFFLFFCTDRSCYVECFDNGARI